MPTYEYACSACGGEFEAFQSMKDAPLTQCTCCGKEGTVRRKIGGGAGLIFKGTGFYQTDYKKSSPPSSSKSSEGGGTGGGTAASGSSTPAKPSS
jgi:putative FmdB family regulatory protein